MALAKSVIEDASLKARKNRTSLQKMATKSVSVLVDSGPFFGNPTHELSPAVSAHGWEFVALRAFSLAKPRREASHKTTGAGILSRQIGSVHAVKRRKSRRVHDLNLIDFCRQKSSGDKFAARRVLRKDWTGSQDVGDRRD